MENFDGREISFRADWNINPFTAPQLVNQVMMSEGTGTQFGGDGLLYMHLGHVSPPVNLDQMTEGEEPVLQVNHLGYFVLSVQRAKEIRNVLDQIILNTESKSLGGNNGGDQ